MLQRIACHLLAFVLTLLCIPGVQAQTSGNDARPNVLLIIADDLGYGDVSAYGGAEDVSTPNIDRLAESGVRFTNGYVTAGICSPSRIGLLTGRYQQRFGTYGYGNATLPADEMTLAEILKRDGYATGMIGKAHYGGAGDPENPEFPLNHGFDMFYGREGGTMDYVRHTQAAADQYADRIASQMGVGPMWRGRERVDQWGYTTDLFTQHALDFVEKERDRPFFLTLSYNAVHLFIHQFTNTQLLRNDLERVGELAAGTTDWEEYLEWYVTVVKPNTPQGRERYKLHLEKMDRAIGQLLDTLEETGQRDNTIIVFVSDNGGTPFNWANNAPLSGYKYTVDEGGIRVPFLIAWPDGLPDDEVSSQVVSALDVVPTVAAATGADLPQDRTIDGVNLLPYLAGEKRGESPHEALYWTGFLPLKAEPSDAPEGSPRAFISSRQGDRHGWAIRRGEYKLRFFGVSREFRLYDLAEDPGEHNDISDERPELVNELKSMWQNWHQEMKADQE